MLVTFGGAALVLTGAWVLSPEFFRGLGAGAAAQADNIEKGVAALEGPWTANTDTMSYIEGD